MVAFSGRLRSIWRQTFDLGWPIAVQQTLTTLMRTVDIVVTGLFSPAAVAAIGLADLYAQFPLRIGLGFGAGAIALSSQDTGRGAAATRDRAVTQALVLGALCGVPLVAVGLLFSETLIRLLGADPGVVRLGGAYLLLVFAAAPFRIVGLVGARSLQGAGDTRTPMLVNGGTNLLNVGLTVALGLGVGVAPRLGIVGVGIATAVSRLVESGAILSAMVSDRTSVSLARPRDLAITRQLVAVSVPTFAEGMSNSLANFPFNALLVTFGTEVAAAYHIGRRIYQQLSGPLYRSFSTVTSIVVGQRLGDGDPEEARFAATAILGLSVVALTTAGGVLVFGAGPLASVFTDDAATLAYAVEFTRVFGVSMVFFGVFFPLSGALRGAGETRIPFYARLLGSFAFMVGLSYLLGVTLGYGLQGIYVGLALSYACWAVVVSVGFVWGDWAETAASMMAERAERESAVQQ
ncbi:MATE family efflux transporter [Halomarina salina]|uniref:Multidrug-efflux transporter n=1 Tax=Halomarina salina TaxID=1872699 RepID=A0ABD5RRB5_9EURY|nr:MATE family efflux transporter [Halomarina salina]